MANSDYSYGGWQNKQSYSNPQTNYAPPADISAERKYSHEDEGIGDMHPVSHAKGDGEIGEESPQSHHQFSKKAKTEGDRAGDSSFMEKLLEKLLQWLEAQKNQGTGSSDTGSGDDSDSADIGGGGDSGYGSQNSSGASTPAPVYTPGTPPPVTSDSGTQPISAKSAVTPATSSALSNTSAGSGTTPNKSLDLKGGKEGLGVSDTSVNGDGSNLASSKSSWYYDWSANPSDKVNDPNAQFIPMIWGQANMNDKDLAAAKNSNSPMLFTFNEPDLPGQSNMSPQQALDNWDKLEATGKKLASPAISNGPDGVKWLDQFMQGAKDSGKTVDSISLHWYGSSGSTPEQNVDAMKSYIEQIHEKYPDKPINLTEFGVDASGNFAGQDPEFLKQAEQMLNNLDYVQMYAPYGLGTPDGNSAA